MKRKISELNGAGWIDAKTQDIVSPDTTVHHESDNNKRIILQQLRDMTTAFEISLEKNSHLNIKVEYSNFTKQSVCQKNLQI